MLKYPDFVCMVKRKREIVDRSVVESTADPASEIENIERSTDPDVDRLRLIGKDLLKKVAELSHLSKRDTAIECGYVKESVAGKPRVDLSGFYDAVLLAKGIKLDETVDRRGKIASYQAIVHKSGQLVIGSVYTREMGLTEGDTLTIKLGYKHIHLILDLPTPA
jgi:AbrB-like transcriptional regulator